MKTKHLLKSTYLIMAVFFTFGLQLNAQNCDASLQAHRNRDKRMIMPNDGTVFKVDVKNNERTPQTFTISTQISAVPCEDNKGGEVISSIQNPPLVVRVLQNGKGVDQLTVRANSTAQILVEVEMGSSAVVNSWHCLELVAKPLKCSDEIVLPLQVLVSDGRTD